MWLHRKKSCSSAIRQGLQSYGHYARSREVGRIGLANRRLDLSQPNAAQTVAELCSPEASVLYSIPPIGAEDPNPALLAALRSARRLVYISTTSVYGTYKTVGHSTPAAPQNDRERRRVTTEDRLMELANTIVLRPAAIYGPYRGIHSTLRRGVTSLTCGDNYVSRIHVDDLAAHCEAALLTNLRGRWPVADDEPCTSREIVEFCSRLLDVRMPGEDESGDLARRGKSDRRVDGSEIRRLLGLTLRYPTYRQGIPSSIDAEERERS